MPLKLVLELEGIANSAVQLDCRLASDGKGLPVGGERMVRNGIVEEVVDFWFRHCGNGGVCDRSGSLLSLELWDMGYLYGILRLEALVEEALRNTVRGDSRYRAVHGGVDKAGFCVGPTNGTYPLCCVMLTLITLKQKKSWCACLLRD